VHLKILGNPISVCRQEANYRIFKICYIISVLFSARCHYSLVTHGVKRNITAFEKQLFAHFRFYKKNIWYKQNDPNTNTIIEIINGLTIA
jgi:hypothetical protein